MLEFSFVKLVPTYPKTTLRKRYVKAAFGNLHGVFHILLKEGRIRIKILLSLKKYIDIGLCKCTRVQCVQ